MSTTSDVEARLASLEAEVTGLRARVRALEDEREIQSLLARYGITADTDDDDGFVELYTDDGTITMANPRAGGDGVAGWQGKDGIRAFIADPNGHRSPALHGRSMHLHGNNLVVRVEGDDAVAGSYGVTLVKGDDGTRILSAAGNRWDLRRVDGEWRIRQRSSASIGDGRFAVNLDLDPEPALDADPTAAHPKEAS